MDPEHQEQFPHNLTISLSPPTGNTTSINYTTVEYL